MYTATIRSKSADTANQRTVLVVDFTNGVKTNTMTLPFAQDISFENVKRRLKFLAEEMDKAENEVANIVTGPIDFTTVTPSQEQAKTDWYNGYSRLKQVQELIDLGVILSTNAKVIALRDKVKADFKPEYLNLI